MKIIAQNISKISLIFILGLKELRINLFALIITMFVPFFFIVFGFSLSILYFENFEIHNCIFLINRIGILVPLLFGEFFIARENKKGTYTLIRTMPISDRIMYLGKNVFGWCILIVSEIPGFSLLYIYFEETPLFIYPIIIISLLIFATTVTLFLILKFGFRATFLLTNVITETLIYLWREFEDLYPESANYVSQSDLLYILASVLLLIGTYIFYRLGVRHFLMRDTRELIA